MKYASQITAIGDLAQNLLDNNRSIILINDQFAKNLVNNLAIQHASAPLEEEIQSGDTLSWGNLRFTVTEVGDEANQSFRESGHCTLLFNENLQMPGQIALQGSSLPSLKLGEKIEIR